MASTTPSRQTLPAGPSVVGEIEPFLAEMIAHLEPDVTGPPGRGRPRILPAVALWRGLLGCIARGFSSQLALWRLLSQTRRWDSPRFAITDQAVYRRLASDGIVPPERLFHQVTAVLTSRLDALAPPPEERLAPFATAVVALDATTRDPVARALSAPGDPPAGRRLPGQRGTLFDLRRQQWRQVAWVADADQNEKGAARTVLAGLERGALILADLGYFGFRWFDELSDAGDWWVSRRRERASDEGVTVLAQHGETLDALVARGRAAGFIRPARRGSSAPDPPLAHAVAWESIAFRRTPRYAERRCAPSAPTVPPISWN